MKRLHDNIEDEVNSDADKVEEIYKSFQEYIFTNLRRGSHYEDIQNLESDKNYAYVGRFEEKKLQLIKDYLTKVVLELEDGRDVILIFVQDRNPSPSASPTDIESRFYCFLTNQSDTENSSSSGSSSALSNSFFRVL